MRKIIAAIAIVGVWLSLTTAANSAEIWGAYTSYDFDQYSGGQDGYGLAWNYPDPEQAMRAALEQCRKQQPPPPTVRPNPNQHYNPPAPERCGDEMIAFSTNGPYPTEETVTPDPTRYEGFNKYKYLYQFRCVVAFSFNALDDGSGPIQYAIRAGDSEEEALARLGDDDYKVEKLACNDR